ncbi:MAG TPA: SHOCT domain-containing protein [Microthrixaceae bacterium]|nr:SHOCT domain-containing protein [Microthrixaceae bacterium]HMT61464.1 SHOCT domain-containing protein [Microthrixaceae bacterium]
MSKSNLFLPGERIEGSLGSGTHIIVLTDRRILVVKVGWTAGSTGGGCSASFEYGDVTGLQANLGMLMGTLSVQSPGFGATQTGDYWNSKNKQNWQELPNVIPWSKTDHSKFAADLAHAQRRIHDAKSGDRAASAPSSGLTAELQQLATLHRDGSLTDEEFEAAKRRLLNG